MGEIRRPEEIEKEIESLKKELKKSKEHFEYELLCNDEWSDDMIGFFNLGNARKILTALYEGKTLQLRHCVYGVYIIKLNPQRNGIIVSSNYGHTHITENNIMDYIVWNAGEFYIKKGESN